jgi:hypothetical protein
MKGFNHILFVSVAAFGTVAAMPAKGGKAASAATITATGISRGASTVVMKEVGGVPGNECLTFRNNGKCWVNYSWQRPSYCGAVLNLSTSLETRIGLIIDCRRDR